MADEDLGCCATLQKWLLFIVNFVLFIFGVAQIGVAAYMLSGSGDLGFINDVMDGDNDQAVNAMLAFGILIVFISFLACCGAAKENKCLLWVYCVILFFLIMGQAMVVAVGAVAGEYGEEIFESLWKDLDSTTVTNIEDTYECCSFNGDVAADTWPADNTDWTTCSAANTWSPMETCWDKFQDTIDNNYLMLQQMVAIALGVQILIYFCTHYVIQSIAQAEGVDKEADRIEATGMPSV